MQDITVAVTFIDATTGKPIARSDVPLTRLPDTFAIDTELDMAGEHFVIVRADPESKAVFAETRELTVTLRKTVSVDPKTILFSLATISGAALPKSGEIVVVHEDDFRQYEFVDARHHAPISEEFSAIRRIHLTAAAGVGWREIHVRDRIGAPLPDGLHWPRVAALLGDFERIGGIAFGDRSKPVIGAIAVRLPEDVILWGVEEAGNLQVLCVENLGTASEATTVALKRVTDGLSLALLDWCRCRAYPSADTPIVGALGEPWDGAD